MKFKPLLCVLFFLGLVFVLLIFAVVFFFRWLDVAVHVPVSERVFVVNKGSSVYSLGDQLQEKNIIAWPRVWVAYARLADLTSVKAGEYDLPDEISPLALLKKFNSGAVIRYQTTFVEGWTFKQFLSQLHTNDRIRHELKGLTQDQIIRKMGLDIVHPEGWFFPDTYTWSSGDSDISILTQAHSRMREVLQSEWQGRAGNLPYKDPYEALVMASIVEKETGAAFERKLIAGVFVRRLQANMRLQTDPSVIYGMGDKYDGNIRRKDLKQATPYNTYVIKGLPPTPIAMPGQEAINAALHPADGKALYFVAKGDGTHYFSESFAEHNQAVRKYQLRRKKNYRSSPGGKSQ